MVKNLPAIQETWFDSWLGRSPGGGMATHSSILAWKIPWTVEPSTWSLKESDTTDEDFQSGGEELFLGQHEQ